ncbi:uncharacterized protein LOC143200541 [Rhynchophorus ferrugineus]|uniref:uncharacterized protein LOC143200541 n=1 Tax=Rhynchophorus ferrugineus TaxID=354439 RepID=UPI003FCCD4E7
MTVKNKYFFVLLTLIGIVNAIDVEGQLAVIKNDCYERMAIGEKLSPKQTYKTFDHNTVSKCEMECTQENDTCRAFSFGIGTKGNGTCLLSKSSIRETGDLKPIGTIADPDYDLYIKKVDCKIVIDPPDNADSQKLPDQVSDYSNKPTTIDQDHRDDKRKPPRNQYHQDSDSNYYGVLNRPYQEYDNGYQYNRPSNNYGPQRPVQQEYGTHHVQTLVSISSGPQSVLHPVHDILVAGNGYDSHRPQGLRPSSNYDNDNLPPYRPASLSHPYHKCKPQGDSYPNDHGRPSRPASAYGDLSQPDLEYDHSRPRPGERPGPYAPNYKPAEPYPDLPYGSTDPYLPSTDYDRPQSDYELKPFNYQPSSGYSDSFSASDRRKYQSVNKFDSYESHSTGYHPPTDPSFNYYDQYDRPDPSRPNRYGSIIPHPSDYDFRPSNAGHLHRDPEKPNGNGYDQSKPDHTGYKPNGSHRQPRPDHLEPNQDYDKPRPNRPDDPNGRPLKPSTEMNRYEGVDYDNKHYGKPGEYGDEYGQKVVSHSIGRNGQRITSIITELKNTCFRRTLAGKRTVRSLVRKLLFCETVEQCQWECGDEHRFTCEGFNYRLDPSGRGKGECELLDLPLSKIDIAREVISDPDYDYYTRDRNAVQVNCRQRPSNSFLPSYGDRRYGYYDDRRVDRPDPYDRRPTEIARPLRRPGETWDYDERRPRPRPIDQRPSLDDDRRYEYGNRRGDYSYHHSHESHSSSYHYKEHSLDRFDSDREQGRRPYPGINYLPTSWKPFHEDHQRPHNFGSYRPFKPNDDGPLANTPYFENRYPPNRGEYLPSLAGNDYGGLNRYGWGSYGGLYGNFGHSHSYYGNTLPRYHGSDRFTNIRRNYYYPKPDAPKDWGLYGGSYGTGGLSLEYQGYGSKHSYSYWGFNKYQDDRFIPPLRRKVTGYLPPPNNSYLPLPRPSNHYLPEKPALSDLDNSILPLEPRRPPNFHTINDECSLRSATGFRLHKRIVKKYLAVPNIYECELLCVKERDFPCASYAFRYSISLSSPTDNCYLSNRNYKDLDYYIDIEPDKDFDIYTMNNRNRCSEPFVILEREHSDCFWRVRSGQRLSNVVARDSLTVKSIVDCQLECLKSRRFTCRSYSYRYGSPIIGGVIDNCQLTDWPFFELDPKSHFVPEPGFEIYERGSFGHGCEIDHFDIRGKPQPKDEGIKFDQICYIGFGSAARLLPQATIKSVRVPTELDCKIECSKAREGTLFRCMSFSFRTGGSKIGHNCFLSDIMQRDLLPNVDYVQDPDSWLFTWDHYNPECVELAYKPLHSTVTETRIEYTQKYGYDYLNALDVWRVYSVSGWPCKKGTLCKENREAGFWYCELEGGDSDSWDYCCCPDHHCGLSKGYPYSWCYVGPEKTQWRKCSDHYYPYIHNVIDRNDHKPPRPQSSAYRPDRPNASIRPQSPRPSLDQYEEEFDNEFLSPPKPGGFGEPRRWPVSYLHKDMPNNTDSSDKDTPRSASSSKFAAIKSLIDVIKNNDFQNVQYHIVNDSNKPDDVLFVKIPLPNLDDKKDKTTEKPKRNNEIVSRTKVNFDAVDEIHERIARMQKSFEKQINSEEPITDHYNRSPVFRRGFVTRTNITNIKKHFSEPFQ